MNNMFWSVKFFLDEILLMLINTFFSMINFLNFFYKNKTHLKENVIWRNKYSGQKGFLVANGPSISKQDLSLLKNHLCFFVNQSYKHPKYSEISPDYHVFIDEKLASGVWDIECLDYIFKLNPNVTFILNSKWYKNKKFSKFKNNKKYKIIWIDCRKVVHKFLKKSSIDLTKICPSISVTGAAFSTMIYMGFRKINLVGQDGNGLCYELVGKKTHFYGENYENKNKTIKEIHKDLNQMSLSIKQWINYSKFCERNNIKVKNCTEGGIFEMFERNSLVSETLKDK